MNSTELKGNWEQFKGKMKQKFATLTDDDFKYQEGKQHEVMGKLQTKLGKTKEEFDKIVKDL